MPPRERIRMSPGTARYVASVLLRSKHAHLWMDVIARLGEHAQTEMPPPVGVEMTELERSIIANVLARTTPPEKPKWMAKAVELLLERL